MLALSDISDGELRVARQILRFEKRVESLWTEELVCHETSEGTIKMFRVEPGERPSPQTIIERSTEVIELLWEHHLEDVRREITARGIDAPRFGASQ